MDQAGSPNLPRRPDDTHAIIHVATTEFDNLPTITHDTQKLPKYSCFIKGQLESELKLIDHEFFARTIIEAHEFLVAIPEMNRFVGAGDVTQRLLILIQCFPEWDWLPDRPSVRFRAYIGFQHGRPGPSGIVTLVSGPFAMSPAEAINALRGDIKTKQLILKIRNLGPGRTVGQGWIANSVRPAVEGCTTGGLTFPLLKHLRFGYGSEISEHGLAMRIRFDTRRSFVWIQIEAGNVD